MLDTMMGKFIEAAANYFIEDGIERKDFLDSMKRELAKKLADYEDDVV